MRLSPQRINPGPPTDNEQLAPPLSCWLDDLLLHRAAENG
jgi:hypothetical protein